MKRTWFSLLWLLVTMYSLELVAAPPALNFTSNYGVCIHTGSLRDGDIDLIKKAGFTWVRVNMTWSRVESQLGKYNFSDFDKLYDQLRAKNIRVLAILNSGNPHYADKGDTPPYTSRANTSEFRAAYAAYSVAAIARYAGRGYIWEQWNEPNNPHGWAPAPDSAAYIALMKQACIEIRKRFPHEIIIGPATAGVSLGFIEDCLRGGMLEYWSAISWHPYRQSDPETAAADYAKLRALIAKYAPANRVIPIICGECGYSTAWKGFDDAKQADYLTRMFQFNHQEKIPLTIWYDWCDDGDNPKEQEHRFGLVRRSRNGAFEPKPAYFAVRKALTEIPSAAQ